MLDPNQFPIEFANSGSRSSYSSIPCPPPECSTPPPSLTILQRQRSSFGWDPTQHEAAWSKKQIGKILVERGDHRRAWPRCGSVLCDLERRYKNRGFAWTPVIIRNEADGGTITLDHDNEGYTTLTSTLAHQFAHHGVATGTRVRVEHNQRSHCVELFVGTERLTTFERVRDIQIVYTNRPTFQGAQVTIADLALLDARIFDGVDNG